MQSPFLKRAGKIFLIGLAGLYAICGWAQRETFYVQGEKIFAPNGERFIARGVNKMIFYNDRDGDQSYPEIAKTGANIVRIFWFTTGTAAELHKTLTNCIQQRMVAVPAVWEATGKMENLQRCVDYWARPDIVAVLQKYRRYVWLNIANEAGNSDVPIDSFQQAYSRAVLQLRKAGLTVPLVIDAAGWGRKEEYILQTGKHLLAVDSLRNLIFSWHPWDADAPKERIKNTIDAARKLKLPFIVGEFAHKSVGCVCCIPFEYIVAYCRRTRTGWLAWEWGPGNSDCEEMDMTKDGRYETLHGWGSQVVETLKGSIKKTARRPLIFPASGQNSTDQK